MTTGIKIPTAAEAYTEEFLSHYGVKGMRWGVRKKRNIADEGPTDVTTSHTPGRRVQTSGGQRQPAHEDAIRNATARQKARSSTVDALSDKELKALVNRMNLEKQYAQLVVEMTPRTKAQKFVNMVQGFAQVAGKQYAQQLVNEQMKTRMDDALGLTAKREKARNDALDRDAAAAKARRDKYS